MCSLNPIGDLMGLGQGRKTPPPATPQPAPVPDPKATKPSGGTESKQTRAARRKPSSASLRIKRDRTIQRTEQGAGVGTTTKTS